MSETHAEYMRNCRVADREQAQQDYQDRYHMEPVEPFSRIPKCILKKRREDELRKSDAEATPKEEAKVLPVRKPDNKAGGPTASAIGRGFTAAEASDMFQ